MGKPHLGRRAFIKTAALAGAGLAAGGGTDAVPEAAAAAAMPRKPLGTTGETVPILQMGTAQFMDPVYDKKLHRCFQEGVNYLDTALSYGSGRSHAAVATFLEQIEQRDKVWITSKSTSRSPDRWMRDLDEALEELRTDHLDMYFMHNVSNPEQLSAEWRAAHEAVRKSGKTRFVGFSCHQSNVVEMINTAAKRGGIDAILFRYHFGRYGDRELNLAIDAAKKAGIGLIAMKVQRSVPSSEENVVKFTSEKFSLAQAKLKAVWADERIDSVVSEMTSVQEVRENVAAARSTAELSAGEVQQLHRIAARTAHLYCEGCSDICQSRVAGTPAVADMLRYLMYHESYGDTERARRLYRELPEAARRIEAVDFGAATAACPQGIDIAARLSQAKAALA